MKKPSLHVVGMFGIGDNLHQRAVIIELLKFYEVWLETCHVWIYRDLLDRGDLHLMLRPTSLWMHVQNVQHECALHPGVYNHRPPPRARQVRIWYLKREIDQTGSMLGAMFLAAGLPVPSEPDFRIRIRPEWHTPRVAGIIEQARAFNKPVMVYRPLVLRHEWDSHLRNADPQHYADLYQSVRDEFFTISIASLKPEVEWVVGNPQAADMKIHDGSLEMWEMAALFAAADVAFVNAGMGPVLAQAVGTPSVVVYGGRESFRTSQRAGAHLAPTLGIDPINPCDCHSHSHQCDKRIDVPPAIAKIREFLHESVAVRHNLRRYAGEARDAESVVQDG